MSIQDPNAVAEQPKKKRGGARPGAGRKPNYFKKKGISPVTAAELLDENGDRQLWGAFLKGNAGPELQFQALKCLTEHRDGKPKQAVQVSGGIAHAHTVYRSPLLAGLSDEEIRTLDMLTKRLELPAATAAQDGPNNQIESKPAIEAIEVEVTVEEEQELP